MPCMYAVNAVLFWVNADCDKSLTEELHAAWGRTSSETCFRSNLVDAVQVRVKLFSSGLSNFLLKHSCIVRGARVTHCCWLWHTVTL